jgi:toxin ParE1/3/4
MMTVRILPAAQHDLDEHAWYLAARSLETAIAYGEAVATTLDRLSDMPALGRAREFNNPLLKGVRSLTVSGFRNYIIFYRPLHDAIEVIRVLHAAQDLASILEHEPPPAAPESAP